MVNATLELVGITIVAVAVLYAGAFLFVKKVMDNSDDTTIFHLAQPLIVSNEPAAVRLRLDAALRDAEEGFNACGVCGFENLKRNIFCSLCGAAVQAVPVVTLPSEAKDLLDIEGSVVSANDHQHRRKARALKRKEWTRRLDVEGKLYWFRDAFRIDSGSHLRRGFVVQFSGSPLEKLDPVDSATPEQPEIEPLLTEDRDADARVKDDANQPELRESVLELSDDDVATDAADGNPQPRTKRRLALRSLEDTQQVLLSEKSARELTLVDSSIADPSRPSVLLHATSLFSEDPNTLVRNTTLDFPSKMAEFVTRTSTAVMVADQSFLKVNIRRNKLLQNSIEAFAAMPADHTRCPMRMAFLGEQGIDAGGVYREWLELVSQEIVVPEAGIFRCVDSRDRSFYLNPTSQHDIGEHHLAHIFATGRLLGRMLLEGNVTGFHLALPLLKIMVGQPVTFSDLEFFDPDAYKNLSWLLENDGVDALGLDFTVTKQTANGQTIVVELIPNGANIDVTDANKHEYVDLKFKYLLFGSVESQLFAFLKGLYEVMPPELLMLFDAEELDFVLSGSDEIDVDDWKRNSKYSIDLADHPMRQWFWEIVREMPNEYRRRLLLFSTGSSRVPLAGFASLTSYDGRLCPFMLKGMDLDFEGGNIRSHACFNQLDLPRYYRKTDLETVLYALLDTDVYGFTSA